MISRRFLIAMFAAMLGLAIARWLEVEIGFNAFRTWAIAQLAEWDSWHPVEDDPTTIAELPQLARPGSEPIASRPVVMSDGPPTPSIASDDSGRTDEGSSDRRGSAMRPPIDFGYPSQGTIALAWIAGENDPASTIEVDAGTHPASVESREHASSDDLAVGSSNRSIESSMAMDYCKFAEISDVDQTLPDLKAVDQDATETGDQFDSVLDERPADDRTFEDRLRSDEGQQRIATAPRPVFESIEPFEAPDSTGVADELNRASEGLGIVPPRAGRNVQPESAPERALHVGFHRYADILNLRRAVRTTVVAARVWAAARAWMDAAVGATSDQMALR